ncbi:MAG TPA: metalloregulator ArsR/SmtB family transcription factor [Terriglobales bacterium]|nr:metalloregulator ArsR/SmtB family transcription factor [Terriglobales bacterium]
METLLRALSEKVRLRILHLIGDTELCVCFFVESLQLPQPTISRHLGYLRRSNLVSARREGLWMHYRVQVPGDPQVAQVLRDVMRWCDSQPDMQKDRQRLTQACCAPEKFVKLENVPLPKPVGKQ